MGRLTHHASFTYPTLGYLDLLKAAKAVGSDKNDKSQAIVSVHVFA